MKEKLFNYQVTVIPDEASDERIVFVGKTSLVPSLLINDIDLSLKMFCKYEIESFIYQPFIENGTEKTPQK